MAKSVKKAAKKAAAKPAKKAAKAPAKAVKKAAPAKKAAPKKAAAKKAAPKKAAPKKAAKKAAPKKAAKRGGGAGLSQPLTVTPQLAAIVGNKPMPRTQIIKKIWDYIKANKLQDKTNKRMINADAKLSEIFGGKSQVSMFDLAKIVSANVK